VLPHLTHAAQGYWLPSFAIDMGGATSQLQG